MIVEAPPPTGTPPSNAHVILRVKLHPGEDIEWVWSNCGGIMWVSGYKIVKK